MSLTLPTVTGYSAFWQTTGDKIPYAMIPQAQGGGRSKTEYVIARLLSREHMRELRAAWLALTGAAAGGTATATYKRRQAPTGPDAAVPVTTAIDALGGNIPIETVTVINRATTAADEAYIEDILDDDLLSRNMTYPTVLGSGGGGKIVNGTVGF